MRYINYFVSLALILSSLSAQAQGSAQSQTPSGIDRSVKSGATGTPAKSGETAAVRPQAMGAGSGARISGASGKSVPIAGGAMRPAVPGASPYATGDEDETNDLEVQRRTMGNSTATRNAGAGNGTMGNSTATRNARAGNGAVSLPGSSGPVNPQAPGVPNSIPVHK
jgi:hypothetical protein